MNNDKGFSMIEVVVVVAIIGILAALTIPNFSEYTKNARLKRAARDIYSNMQKSRISAIKNSENVCLVFDPGNRKYEIKRLGADDKLGTQDDVLLGAVTLPRGIVFGSATGTPIPNGSLPDDGVGFGSGNSVNFKPDGSTSVGGTAYVSKKESKDNKTLAVSLQFVTGNVRLWKNNGGGWEK